MAAVWRLLADSPSARSIASISGGGVTSVGGASCPGIECSVPAPQPRQSHAWQRKIRFWENPRRSRSKNPFDRDLRIRFEPQCGQMSMYVPSLLAGLSVAHPPARRTQFLEQTLPE